MNMSMAWIISTRVWVDENTNDKINQLLQIGRGFINREKLFNGIIYEWIVSGGITNINNITYIDKYGKTDDISKIHCIWIVIENNLWGSFKILCSKKGLNINIGFKIAVNYFIDIINEDSTNMLIYFLAKK